MPYSMPIDAPRPLAGLEHAQESATATAVGHETAVASSALKSVSVVSSIRAR
jgi:nucleoid-associated protein YgaU